MAIEIKELHVRLFMGNAYENANQESPQPSPCPDTKQQEQMIQDTAREVLRMLKQEERR